MPCVHVLFYAVPPLSESVAGSDECELSESQAAGWLWMQHTAAESPAAPPHGVREVGVDGGGANPFSRLHTLPQPLEEGKEGREDGWERGERQCEVINNSDCIWCAVAVEVLDTSNTSRHIRGHGGNF
jgi:hypothetical protein